MMGKVFRKALVVVLSAVIISLMCPVSVLAAGDVSKLSTPISLGQNYTGTLTDSNISDWYKFTVPCAGCVAVASKASDSSVIFSLFYGSDAENQIFYSELVWNEYEQAYCFDFSYDLTGGTYYLLVTKDGEGISDYEFSVNFADIGESCPETYDKNNNSFATASKIYLNTDYTGCFVYNDDIDYFKFTVPMDTAITIRSNSYMRSVGFYLYDSNLTNLEYDSISATGSNTSLITRDVKKGTYYFVVRSSGVHYGIYNFSVIADNLPGLSITRQPTDYQGVIGGIAVFSVAAKGKDLKYQWQTYKNSKWVDSSFSGNATSALYVPVSKARDGYQFRCLITDSYEQSVTSDVVFLELDPIYVVTEPKDVTAEVGDTAQFSVVAESKELEFMYQWQTYRSGSWVDSSFTGAKSATLSVPVTAARNGYKFRCVLTASDYSFSTSSQEAVLTVKTPLAITSQPKDYVGTIGSTAKFTVIAQGEGLKYQWQTYTNGKWVDSSLPGYNTATLSVPVTASRNGYKFQCVITDSGNKTVTSKPATLKITAADTQLAITANPKNYSGPVGSTAKFKVVAQGTGLKYQWQTYKNGKWVNSSLPGYNTAVLSVPVIPSRNGYKFRCVVTDSKNDSLNSKSATLKVV